MRPLVLAAALALLPVACRESGVKTPAGAGASAQEASAPVAGAFCQEHGVLEAVCTKCNPALVPVFQAKGDWCAEHGFPESFCPTCHPERGGRPAGVGADEAPADGLKVRFKTKETARLAGIQVERAVEAPGGASVSVTARIVYDAAKVTEVNPRSPGVVRALHADLGTRVRPGTRLATLESAGVGADRSRVLAARSRVGLAEASHARLVKLYEDGIAAEKEALAARQELDAARAELSAAQAALGMLGSVAEGGSRYTLTAPIAGVVTRREATLGRLYDTGSVLFEIVDTSSMWAELDIPESEVARVAVGQPVVVTVEGLERELHGRLSYVAPGIDARTRTAMGRVALENRDGALRGNMLARARLTLSGTGTAVVVPRQAVQRARDARLVFVRLADDAYEARRVSLGQADGETVVVSGRLKAGDQVVTEGSFLLKTETLKGSIGAGCCEVEERK